MIFYCYPIKCQQKHQTAKCLWTLVFSASREHLVLHIQNLQDSILLKNSMTLYSFIKYSQMLLLCVIPHDIAFEITIQKRL